MTWNSNFRLNLKIVLYADTKKSLAVFFWRENAILSSTYYQFFRCYSIVLLLNDQMIDLKGAKSWTVFVWNFGLFYNKTENVPIKLANNLMLLNYKHIKSKVNNEGHNKKKLATKKPTVAWSLKFWPIRSSKQVGKKPISQIINDPHIEFCFS